ncbi:MAG: transglutaminase family protein [Methyloceanibacter sp.]
MSIITIRHVTTYKYRHPVAFGKHRMMLRPRDDEDQKVLKADIEITPAPADLTWTLDRFGNHVAMAHFAARASELRFESNIRLNHVPAELRETDIQHFAHAFPFAYSTARISDLAHFMSPRSLHPQLDRWASEFLRKDGSANTLELLGNVTRTINTSFKHEARHEKGIQHPLRTLTLWTGCCRDLAVLMIAALRSLGIAARFVSGYLHVSDDHEDDDAVGGNTHAWVQAYLPGPGWVDLDPSSGVVGNRRHVRVAVVQEPREAIPLQGTWVGAKSDCLGMSVTVKVRCYAEQDDATSDRCRRGTMDAASSERDSDPPRFA